MHKEVQNNPEKEFIPPYIFLRAMEITRGLGHVRLQSANKYIEGPKQEGKDTFSTTETEEKLKKDYENYLIATVSLRPYLHGQSEILSGDKMPKTTTKIKPHDNLNPSDNIYEPEYCQTFQCIPLDRMELSQIQIIINYAYRAMTHRYGLTVNNCPEIEYPFNSGTIPPLLNIDKTLKELPATLLIHKDMVNERTRRSMVKGQPSDYLKDFDQPNLSTTEIIREIVELAKHLTNDWEKVDTETFVDTIKDDTGSMKQVSVKGWARLEIDPEFVKLARRRVFNDLTNRMKNTNFDFNKHLPKFRIVDENIIEYEILSLMFYALWSQNETIISQLDKYPTNDWQDMTDVTNDPTIMIFDESGRFKDIPGMLTDIPETDVFEKCMLNRGDNLLTSTDTGPVSLRGKHYIYVHPKIWKFIHDQVGSKLKLD